MFQAQYRYGKSNRKVGFSVFMGLHELIRPQVE